MENFYQDLIDMANKIIDNQMNNPKNQGIVIFFASTAKTIIDKKYRKLYVSDIKNADVGGDTSFIKGFEEANKYLNYGYNFDSKRVLFLTDGEDDSYNRIDYICKKMKNSGYIINIIGFGRSSTFQNLKEYASEGCFDTGIEFEQVKEICIQAFAFKKLIK